MLKCPPLIAAGVFVIAVIAIAASGPAAIAAGPKCKTNANPYVACTDRLKAKTQHRRSGIDYLPNVGSIKGETESRRKLRPWQ